MKLTGFELVSLALKIHGKSLKGAKGLLLQLCDYWGRNNQIVFAGGEALQIRVGISETSLTTHIKTLEGLELIAVKRCPNRPNQYRLNVEGIKAMAARCAEIERGMKVEAAGNGAPDFGEPKKDDESGSPNSGEPDPQILGIDAPNSGDDQTSTKPEEQTRGEIKDMATPKLDFSALNLSDEHIDTIKAIRKAKKAPLTQLAIKGIGKHLDACRAAGATDDDYMMAWAETGWSVMKAEWFLRDWRPTGQGIALVGQPAHQQRPINARHAAIAANDQMIADFLADRGDQYQGNTYDAER